METFTAQVGEIDNLTHDVRVIRLELIHPPEIRFQAGQFVSFEVPKPGLPFPVTRPYRSRRHHRIGTSSICS